MLVQLSQALVLLEHSGVAQAPLFTSLHFECSRCEEKRRESTRRGETYRLFSLSSLGFGVGAIFRLGRLSRRSVFVSATADVLQGTEQKDVSAKALCQVRSKRSEVRKNRG